MERDEPALLAHIRGGEKKLFHELIRPYERSVYLTGYSILHNEADAEEVAQEAMLKAYVHLGELRSDVTFKAWLLRIAVNEARMRRRKDHKHLFDPLEEESHESDEGEFVPREFADWREIPSEALERKQIRAAVDRALRSLPEMYREVFLLRDVQHLSVAETAQALEISIPSVKTRLYRARLQMREALAPLFRRPWHERLLFRKGRKPW